MKNRSITIRPIRSTDYEFVLKTNEDNVEVLSPMNQEKLEYFERNAELFLVAEVDSEPAAFLIALREGVDSYESENYRWFSKNYKEFLYVDRIVINENYRKMGLGRKLYHSVFSYAVSCGVSTVTAEIDTIPYNETSLKFHKSMGFTEVGMQVVRDGSVEVSLQEARVENWSEMLKMA